MASDNCENTYQLIRGPKGDLGPVGPQGPMPVRAADGPQGDQGNPGKTKIDILTDTEYAPYKKFSGAKNIDTLNTLSSTLDNYTNIITSFIFPGETAFGGLLERVSVLASMVDITGTTYTGTNKQVTFEVFYLDRDTNNNIRKIYLGGDTFDATNNPALFSASITTPNIFTVDLQMKSDIGTKLVYVAIKDLSLKGVDAYTYAIDVY